MAKALPALLNPQPGPPCFLVAVPDYSIGFSQQEVEEILSIQKAELKKTLAVWSDSGSSATKRRLNEIHAIIAACGTGENTL